jgi:uncharacterized membrane protein
VRDYFNSKAELWVVVALVAAIAFIMLVLFSGCQMPMRWVGTTEVTAMTRDMTMFVLGALLAFMYCYGATSSEAASNGWLYGWEVKIGKRVICRDPYLWNEVKEIECER